eukprot:COSAG01_NODE_53889_length_336_cov_0.556962_1_plen_56_part_10
MAPHSTTHPLPFTTCAVSQAHLLAREQVREVKVIVLAGAVDPVHLDGEYHRLGETA